MVVLQHYYTSYKDEETGSAGFQVKAMSPGISPTTETTIHHLISYRIPPTLDANDLSTHPIALRYIALSPQECIFLCSQSCGNDDRGRPGNFFSHTLVMEPQAFLEAPPIFYWQSTFWRKQDTRPRPQARTLPVLPTFNVSPSLSLAVVWDFLAQGERRHLLHQLLAAVIHSHGTQRRIVISDTTEHVALWIAAVSVLLPPSYRPLLSFTTYHHDPYQGQFLITGITPDSTFRASAVNRQSFFILDAEYGATSTVEGSSYADRVIALAQPELYENQLRSFFAHVAQLPSLPMVLDEQLDDIARYVEMPPLPPHTTPQQVQRLWYLMGSGKDSDPQALLLASLHMVGSLWCEGRSEEGNSLLWTLWQATQGQPRDRLQRVKDSSMKVPDTLIQWRGYCDALVRLLLHPVTIQQAVGLLDFWFSVSPGVFQYPYTLPAIFLTLPLAFDAAQKQRSFPAVLRNFRSLVEGKPWFLAVPPLLGRQKSFLSTLRQGIATSFQKREERLGSIEIHQLFAGGTGRQYHMQLAIQLHASLQEQFWASYWKTFTEALVAVDNAFVLDLLSFWFNESFEKIHDEHMLPYVFFLNLPRICKEARQKPGFRGAMQALDEQAREAKHSWYPLIRYFLYEG